MEHSIVALNASEEIKPYRVHVSSKYLELTKKKLELTRLPHEVLLPKAREWEFGTPKSVVEPLIDFWLEHYSWRSREETLNNTLPQYRTAISLPLSSPLEPTPPLRLHFIHIRSPNQNAVPLLLLPPYPLTNLSLSSSPLFKQLSDPEHPTSIQAFHLICPSIPGLGFSDAFSSPSSDKMLEQTAYLFNALMLRLGYTYYLCTSTGSGAASPAGIDYQIPRIIGERYRDNCLGIHVLEPCVTAPTIGRGLVDWMKYNVAKFFHASIWGYSAEDWIALRTSSATPTTKRHEIRNGECRPLLAPSSGLPGTGYGATSILGLREPTTLSYALCDSPVGLLSLICSALQKASPVHKLTETQIIDITQLAWLPGPEAGMRFWSAAAAAQTQIQQERGRERGEGGKAKIAITAFLDSEGTYACPAWISRSHDLVFSQRVEGKAGLTIWERSEVLLEGIRGLAKAVNELDPRIRIRSLEGVIVGEGLEDVGEGDEEDHGMQLDVESPDTVVAVDMGR